jgi:hypothetical protein
LWFFWCILRLWATANYCRAGIKSLRGTIAHIRFMYNNLFLTL